MNTCDHILSIHGIMSNFSIAKKVTKQRLNKLTKELNETNLESQKFQERLKHDILKETQIAYYNNSIPGLITNKKQKIDTKHKSAVVSAQTQKKVAMLITVVLAKIAEKDLSKKELCLFMIQLINGLGLRDVDFKRFHQNYMDQEDDDFDDFDEDEDDDDF